MYQRDEAIQQMNLWGQDRVPFGFMIDFEMEKIILFPSSAIPPNIRLNFDSQPAQPQSKPNDFIFHKFPPSFQAYETAFAEVFSNIHKGNSFLVNLTASTKIETNLTLSDIFEYSTAKYKLMIDNEMGCFSPETFVSIRNGLISTYPMKGTIRDDIPDAVEKLMSNPKEIAEHHTIVDLLRNDLSLVASDVDVKRFRYIDHIRTHNGGIYQVSSEISGRLPNNFHQSIGDIIFAMLPAGSVSGAPKNKTLEIIRSAERAPRGYYTGVCGRFDGYNLDSAVMIRFIEKRNDGLWFRSGGGITCNSDAALEYQELIDKVYVPISRNH